MLLQANNHVQTQENKYQYKDIKTLQINGVAMERVDDYKYLGVWISSNLSWSKHIAEVCRKCYKNASKDMMLKLYLSCIRPDLEYAAPVWSPHLKGQIEDIESVQKLALRVCCKSWDVHYQMLLSKSNIPSLSKRRLFLCLSFLFNIVKESYSLPKHAPIELRESHHYSRSHNLTLKDPFAKTKTFYYSFFCDTICHWNALPPDIIDSISMLNTLKINYMFTSVTCTNLITHIVSYVALIIKCKYVPLIRVHTRISILLLVLYAKFL